jgi:uncharacterized membrane-anchored protein
MSLTQEVVGLITWQANVVWNVFRVGTSMTRILVMTVEIDKWSVIIWISEGTQTVIGDIVRESRHLGFVGRSDWEFDFVAHKSLFWYARDDFQC